MRTQRRTVTGLFIAAMIAQAGLAVPALAEPDPMSGPAVKEPAKSPAATPTLVERDDAGNVLPIQERPETAAVRKLTLSDEEKAKVDALLVERSAAVNTALWNNIDLFLALQGARQAGQREEVRRLMPEFREKNAALLTPPLIERLSGVLSPDHAAQLRTMVEEYSKVAPRPGPGGSATPPPPPAEGPDARRRPGGPGDGPPRPPEMAEAGLLMREMARTLQTTVQERRERMDAILTRIQATDEQAEKIRAIVREQAKGQTPDPKARQEIISRILELLTPEQRREYLRAMREG